MEVSRYNSGGATRLSPGDAIISASEPHVFISHAWKDGTDHAQRLYDALTKRGISAWFDKTNLNPFNDFTGEIDRQIKRASHVVVCVTPDVDREDSYVRLEIGYAKGHRKPIIVAMFEEMVPPSSIVNNTRIYFNRGWDAAFEQLLDYLKRSRDYTAPADDPFQTYLDVLRQEIEAYLEIAIIREIPLHSVETPGAVQTTATKRMLGSLFETTLSVKPEAPKPPRPFDSLGDAFQHFGGRMLLLGEPGAGKTITLMTFVRAMVASRLADRANPLPIFARIADWDGKTALVDWLAGQTEISRDDLAALIASGKALLALDGLDELGSEREDPDTKEKYDPRQRFLSLLPPNAPLIVSCRVTDYAEIGQKAALKGAVTLQPLSDPQIQDYLSGEPDLWAALQSDDDLRDVARTPLLLSLFAYAFNGLDEEAKKLHDLSRGDLRDRIFETYARRRYEHEAHRRTPPYPLEDLTAALGRAAMENVGEWYGTANFLEFASLGKDARGLLAQGQLLHLVAVTDATHYRFTHLLLRDYFAFHAARLALGDRDWYTRLSAANALQQLHDVRVVDELLVALGDQDQEVRSSSAIALARLNDLRHDNLLRKVVLNDSQSQARRSTAWALQHLSNDMVIDRLLESLRDRDVQVRAITAWVLGALGEVRAVNGLLNTLGDPVGYARSQAAEALGALGDTRAVEPLVTALDDPDMVVRRSAAKALEKIGMPAVLAVLEAWRKAHPDD